MHGVAMLMSFVHFTYVSAGRPRTRVVLDVSMFYVTP